MATVNKSDLMKYAWRLFKGQPIRTMELWSVSLKSAWNMAKTNPKGLLPILKVVKVKEVLTFNEVYAKYYNTVLHYVNGMTFKNTPISSATAEEITSDTFYKVYRSFADFDESKSSMKSWIFNIAHNTAKDYNRKRKLNTVSISDNVDDNGNETFVIQGVSTTDSEVNNNELMQSINKAFESITNPEHKQIATLHFINQLSYDEIADMLNIPENRIKVTMMRCKAKLQAHLQAEKQAYAIR